MQIPTVNLIPASTVRLLVLNGCLRAWVRVWGCVGCLVLIFWWQQYLLLKKYEMQAATWDSETTTEQYLLENSEKITHQVKILSNQIDNFERLQIQRPLLSYLNILGEVTSPFAGNLELSSLNFDINASQALSEQTSPEKSRPPQQPVSNPANSKLPDIKNQTAKITIQGDALSSRVVADLMTSLTDTQYFTQIELISSNKKTRSETDCVSFSIVCSLPFSKAEVRQ